MHQQWTGTQSETFHDTRMEATFRFHFRRNLVKGNFKTPENLAMSAPTTYDVHSSHSNVLPDDSTQQQFVVLPQQEQQHHQHHAIRSSPFAYDKSYNVDDGDALADTSMKRHHNKRFSAGKAANRNSRTSDMSPYGLHAPSSLPSMQSHSIIFEKDPHTYFEEKNHAQLEALVRTGKATLASPASMNMAGENENESGSQQRTASAHSSMYDDVAMFAARDIVAPAAAATSSAPLSSDDLLLSRQQHDYGDGATQLPLLLPPSAASARSNTAITTADGGTATAYHGRAAAATAAAAGRGLAKGYSSRDATRKRLHNWLWGVKLLHAEAERLAVDYLKKEQDLFADSCRAVVGMNNGANNSRNTRRA